MEQETDAILKSAEVAAKMGEVRQIMGLMNTGLVPAEINDRLEDILIKAVESAAGKGLVTETLEIVGSPAVPSETQCWAIEVIAISGRSHWLSGVFGYRKVPEKVGLKVIETLANEGHLPELLRLAEGRKLLETEDDLPQVLQEKARELLPLCVQKVGSDGVNGLDKKELRSLVQILSEIAMDKNPLSNGGILSKGTVKKQNGKQVKTGGSSTLKV